MPDRANHNRSLDALRREAGDGSSWGVTSPNCVNTSNVDRAWKQNFTNATNEGKQNANNKNNTNNSVRPVRRLWLKTAIFTVEEVLAAYKDCRRNKRNKPTTIDFECNFAQNIMGIFNKIENQTWTPEGHMCFVVRSPKLREVWASPFADRIVHHIVYNRLRPRFEPGFISTTFACIPERGTSGASDWAERAARKVTAGWAQRAYVLSVDIANFFPTINAFELCNLLLKRCPEPWLQHLVREIILVDVKKNAHFPGNRDLLEQIPPHKSLWHKPLGVGLPIGNLTSQFGANVLLDSVDQLFVRSKAAKHYGRYVDDILAFDRSKSRLQDAQLLLTEALATHGLKPNMDKTHIKPIAQGFDFCGRFVKPHRSYLRRATARRGTTAINELAHSLHPAETVTSYLALARHCNGYSLRKYWSEQANRAGLYVDSAYTKARKERAA